VRNNTQQRNIKKWRALQHVACLTVCSMPNGMWRGWRYAFASAW